MADQPVRRGLTNLSVSRKLNAIAMPVSVDVVLVMNGTGSMAPLFEAVKESALSFYDRVAEEVAFKRRRLERMRLKLIVYRDLYCDKTPFEESPFFDLPDEAADFRQFVENVEVLQGGGKPESGLEALWKAIHADFQSYEVGKKVRHIICLMTDAPPIPWTVPSAWTAPVTPTTSPSTCRVWRTSGASWLLIPSG